jgi:two-component system, NarL family, response regulator LiaR
MNEEKPVDAGTNKIRVAFVDDHPFLTESMRDFIEARGDMLLVAACNSGEALLKALAETKVDVVVLDLQLRPGAVQGIDLARTIIRSYPKVRVVVYTAFTLRRTVVAGVRAGVRGWVDKTQPAEDLREAIRAVMNGRTYLSPDVLQMLGEVLSGAEPDTDGDEPARPLTAREQEVMELVVQGLYNKEIAARMGIEVNTVRTDLNNIYKKLHAHDRNEAIIKYSAQLHGKPS